MNAALTSALVAAVLVAGCGTRAPMAEPAPSPPPPRAESHPVLPGVRPAFAQQLVMRAEQAEQRGDWSEATWLRDALVLLEPASSAHRAQAARVREGLVQRVADASGKAREAQRRGDLERAMRGWLAVLALDATNPPAIDALRQIERERNERQLRARGAFSREPAAPTGAAGGAAPTSPSRAAP